MLGDGVQLIGDFDGDGFADVAVSARADERPTNFSADDVVDTSGCAPRRNNSGAIYIFRGEAGGGLRAEPSFVIFGQNADDNLETIAGGIDIDGDDKDDLIIGARFADPNDGSGRKRDAGRAMIYKGRSAGAESERVVICQADAEMIGANANNHLGWATMSLGDINNDGCPESVISEPELPLDGRNRQGAVHILYGWGGSRCYAEPHILSLTVTNGDARFGTSLTTTDADQDGRSDLIVGGFNAAYNGTRPGAVWVIRASEIDALSPRRLDQSRVYHYIDSMVGEQGDWWIAGSLNQSQFSWSVSASGPYLFISAPRVRDRAERRGQGYLYSLSPQGIGDLVGVFAGETDDTYGELGRVAELYSTGQDAWIGFGSMWGRGTYEQGGSVYVGTFSP